MAEEKSIVVVSGYQPPWRNLLADNTVSIRQHLIDAHNLSVDDVAKLRDYECWECHDRLHEQVLGGTLING